MYVRSRATGVLGRDGVATVEESGGRRALVFAGGLTGGRSATTGRAAGGSPKTALCRTGRAPNHTSSIASVVAPPQSVTYVNTRRIRPMMPLRVRIMANVLV